MKLLHSTFMLVAIVATSQDSPAGPAPAADQDPPRHHQDHPAPRAPPSDRAPPADQDHQDGRPGQDPRPQPGQGPAKQFRWLNGLSSEKRQYLQQKAQAQLDIVSTVINKTTESYQYHCQDESDEVTNKLHALGKVAAKLQQLIDAIGSVSDGGDSDTNQNDGPAQHDDDTQSRDNTHGHDQQSGEPSQSGDNDSQSGEPTRNQNPPASDSQDGDSAGSQSGNADGADAPPAAEVRRREQSDAENEAEALLLVAISNPIAPSRPNKPANGKQQQRQGKPANGKQPANGKGKGQQAGKGKGQQAGNGKGKGQQAGNGKGQQAGKGNGQQATDAQIGPFVYNRQAWSW